MSEFQANAPVGLHEVLEPRAAKICIMENQIAELRTLLNEIDILKALDLVVKAVKPMSWLSKTSESLKLSG